jgi:hypothetical protein
MSPASEEEHFKAVSTHGTGDPERDVPLEVARSGIVCSV